MEDLFDKIWIAIDPMVIVLVVAAGYFQRYYLKIEFIGKYRVLPAWKTLFMGTLFVTIYVLIDRGGGKVDNAYLKKAFFSYIFATSFYELILGPVTFWIEKKISFAKAAKEQASAIPPSINDDK